MSAPGFNGKGNPGSVFGRAAPGADGAGPGGRKAGPGAGPGRRKGGRGGERKMVPDATFTSYYGRPVVKASPWTADIPAYLFLGGLAGGSSLLAAGADRTGRPALRRTGRIGALVAITGSFAALVHDLGRPERFVNMLRVAKPTSPMSMGTWFLTAYGPAAGLAGAGELSGLAPARWRDTPAVRSLRALARPAGMAAALVAPAVASYTAVLLSDTATPTWHAGRGEMPFVFVGSAAAAAGGLGMLGAPLDQAGPARRMALAGAVVDLVAGNADGGLDGPGRRDLAPGPGWPPDTGQQRADRPRRGGDGAVRGPEPSRLRRCRRRPAGRLGVRPVRHLRGGPGLRPRPQVHGGAAASTARAGEKGRSKRLARSGR